MGLSEQKERLIFSADPRNTNWSSDKGRFGFKMLEKMGWSEGKGLGAKEDGMQEHVKIKLKTNNFGIGADKKNIRNWLENADGFSELLSRLNSEADTTPADTADEDKKRKKDKKSKRKQQSGSEADIPETAAVVEAETAPSSSVCSNRLSHRSRFRHMKKMALRDEKGLQEIFGVRSAPSTFANTPDTSKSGSPGAQSGSSTPLPAPPSTQTTRTIETGVSVADYFAQKLAANPALAALYGVGSVSTPPAESASANNKREAIASTGDEPEAEERVSKKRKSESSESKEDKKKDKADKKQAKEDKKRAKVDKKRAKEEKKQAKEVKKQAKEVKKQAKDCKRSK
ncbi:hypothetical protein EV174_002261 [Coemansia sp. RSA 2320]|nr:hypothetical protein EV174_002261 [Coemansia sp. RSA 2320]